MVSYVDAPCVHVGKCFYIRLWLVLVAEREAGCVHVGVLHRWPNEKPDHGCETRARQASLEARAWTLLTRGSCPP